MTVRRLTLDGREMDVGSMEAALSAQFPRRTTQTWMLSHSYAFERLARARFEHFDRRSPGHATPRASDRRFRDAGILTEPRRAVKSRWWKACGGSPSTRRTRGHKGAQSHIGTRTATSDRVESPCDARGKFRRRSVVSNDVRCALPLFGERKLG